MAVQQMSELVYVVACHRIGTPEQVASRRDVLDISELFMNKIHSLGKKMISGSHKEGFRLLALGSDVDTMMGRTDCRVIWDFSQIENYSTHENKLILCNSSESPPGYTLLWLPPENNINLILPACVEMDGKLYISSSKYRELRRILFSPDCTENGPCSTGKCTIGAAELNTLSTGDFDIAHCFISDVWPPSASSWKDRCHSWPAIHVVNDILRSGCQFVAIGHKLGNHEDKEWRISFSLAECKLVYSMNHTQFLTYGLLKLILKEIINNELKDEDKILCSYHMKTSLFWAIQQNTLSHWCPQNLIDGLWVCFKLLLKWVYEGICPNFFIPQNNMFFTKIHGQAQATLFRRLYGLYEKGKTLLIDIPFIKSSITDVICNPRLTVCTNTLFSEVDFDVKLFLEIYMNDVLPTSDLHNFTRFIRTVEQLIDSPLTHYQVVMLQKLTATIFQRTAFTLHNMYTNANGNKKVYIADKISCHMLKLAAKFGWVSDMLYIAMYYYRTFRYEEALCVIETTKTKLAQPCIMYRKDVDREMYTEAVGGQSLSTKMNKALSRDFKLDNAICYIPELKQEQSCAQNSTLYIPPYVLLHMLEFLSSRHLETMRAETALDDLTALVKNQYRYILFKDISWEILGICYHITGDIEDALTSYIKSLVWPVAKNGIQTATIQRIINILKSHPLIYLTRPDLVRDFYLIAQLEMFPVGDKLSLSY